MTETRVGEWMRDECDVYAGRGRNGKRFGSADIGERGWLGNPYRADEHGREECIEKFRRVFERRLENDPDFREAVRDLAGKTLGCWCQTIRQQEPACHAEVVAEWADLLANEGVITRCPNCGHTWNYNGAKPRGGPTTCGRCQRGEIEVGGVALGDEVRGSAE